MREKGRRKNAKRKEKMEKNIKKRKGKDRREENGVGTSWQNKFPWTVSSH